MAGIGLGCMGMSAGVYGPADERESLATIDAALDAGIAFFDTGDFYGMGHNELLLGQALSGGRRAKVVLSVKFGAMRDPGGAALGVDASPRAVKNFLTYSLQRLGTDYVDVYRPARLDPAVPIEETIGAIAELVRGGYVHRIGLSEVGAATIRRAQAVHPIADVQLEYSLMSRGIEATILPTLRELGIGVTAYGVLSRGLLSGRLPASDSSGDIRTFRMPRFGAGNVEHNLAMVEALRRIGETKRATPAQLAIAWVRSRGADVLPVIGARRREQLVEALGALNLVLDEADVAAIEAAVPAGRVAGTRYAAAAMAELDSERSA